LSVNVTEYKLRYRIFYMLLLDF